MTAHPYILYLADVACQRPVTVPPPPVNLPDESDPAAFIMKVLQYVGHKPITRHGTDNMIDLMFKNPLFWNTLPHAADIQEHFATTFLRSTSKVFQDHWTYVIVPAWTQLADAYKATQESLTTV
jgi:hypothetical protein